MHRWLQNMADGVESGLRGTRVSEVRLSVKAMYSFSSI